MAGPRRSLMTGGENPEFVTREFPGMNNNPAREAINDDEFYWIENLMPLAPGNMVPLLNPLQIGSAISAETGNPTYTYAFTGPNPLVPGSVLNYIFAVWANSGNGYVIPTGTGVPTQIFTGTLTSGQTAATQYSNLGILIVDPTGYFAWFGSGVVDLNNSVSAVTNTATQTIAGGTSLTQLATVSGTGATFQSVYECALITLVTGGTGYVVGDVLSLTDNNPTTAAQVAVTTVSAGGVITGITLVTAGAYPGPSTSTPTAVTGPTGTTVSGGTGSGATFSVVIKATAMDILTPGSGYSSSDTLSDVLTSAHARVIDSWSITSSGVVSGTSIATYAGRVWIGYQRVVNVTDVDSYQSFGGAGFSFTVNDSYLVNNITALYAANNYLYLFGDASIDAISNVTVVGGVSTFSRINVTTSVGTSYPQSVFGYYRAVCFWHASGIYLLAGATPEKISEKISGVVRAFAYNTTAGGPAALISPVCGGQILIQGELCAAMQFFITDNFVGSGQIRPILAMFFRGRWFIVSFLYNSIPNVAFSSAAFGGTQVGWFFGCSTGNHPYLAQAFVSATYMNWTLQTKLWDGGAPLREKQALSAALGAVLRGSTTSGVTFTVDTEHGSSSVATFPITGTPSDYELMVLQANQSAAQFNAQGAQYLGMTLYGTGADVSRIGIVGLRGKQDRDLIQ